MRLRWFVTLGILAFATGIGAAWGWITLQQLHRVVAQVFTPTTGGIVIHHTATPPVLNGRKVDVAVIDNMHRRRGFAPVVDAQGKSWYIGYHYLIQQDGTILHGRPENLPGSHTRKYPNTIGISLVGNFHSTANPRGQSGPIRPPQAQMAAVIRLTREIMTRRHLGVDKVFLHRDLGSTACPGDRFPRTSFYQALK